MILAFAVLLILALLILVWPLLFRNAEAGFATTETGKRQQEENLALYNERVADLQGMELSDEEKAAMQLELDRELLASQTDGSVSAVADNGYRGRLITAITMFALILASAWGLYRFWGFGDEARATELLIFAAEAELTPAEYSELSYLLENSIRHHPDNLEWTYLHARLLQREGDYAAAATAYADLLKTLPEERVEDRAALMALQAQMQFFANGQQADEDLYRLASDALALVPDQQQALGLAGILAFELGKYHNAIDHWRVLWSGLPQGMESVALENGIRRAAERIETAGGSTDLSWLQRSGIEISVDIAAAVRQQVKPTDTVFVLARSEAGPPMPLAVQRLTVADLPVTVLLDDSMAMAPGMNLSSAEAVTITARISLTGNPVAQSGDWQAQKAGVATHQSEPQSLLIDTLVP